MLNNLNGKKKVGILAGALLVIVGLVVTIFLVQRSQENRTHAQKATTLSLTTTPVTIAPGGSANFDLNLNPGTNQISVVKFTLKFDPGVFDPTKVKFVEDPNSPLKVIEGPVTSTTGTVAYSLGQKDPTKPVSIITKLGILTFPSSSTATVGNYTIEFDKANGNTEARSVGANENPGDDVLQDAFSATVNIAAECSPNVGTCSWDALDGATEYQVVITDNDGKEAKSGKTSDTSMTFPLVRGKTYTCSVKALNDCGGVGAAEVGTGTCAVPSGNATPTPGSTATPTPGSTATPTPRSTATPTPTTPISTATPTVPGVTSVSSPTPTTQIVSSPIPTVPAEISTTPTLPPTGNPLVMGGIIGGILILLGGLALLIL